MMLELPDNLANRLSHLVERRGYPSMSDYLAEIVVNDLENPLESDRDEINELIAEGLEQGSEIPESAELWQHIHNRAKGVS